MDAGSDTYAWNTQRKLATTVTDSGNTLTSYSVQGYAWDQLGQGDTGSSTPTTNGHVYATDTIAYAENTGDTATETQTFSGGGSNWFCTGSAYDYYLNSDNTTQTISDTVTTSFDSFTVAATHVVSGLFTETALLTSSSFSVVDTGADQATFGAHGTKSSTGGDTYSFSASEIQSDGLGLTYSLSNSYNIGEGEETGTSLIIVQWCPLILPRTTAPPESPLNGAASDRLAQASVSSARPSRTSPSSGRDTCFKTWPSFMKTSVGQSFTRNDRPSGFPGPSSILM